MLIDLRNALMAGKRKMPYIRVESGRVAYVLQNAYVGVGQYEIGWLGSVNIGGNYVSNTWCGSFGLYIYTGGTHIRWYISKPANELVSSASTTQHSFFDGINDVSLSLLTGVYNDGMTRGWLVREDNITAGSNKTSKLYCNGNLVSTVTSTIKPTISGISSLSIGIMNGIDLNSATSTTPSGVSPLKAGSKFYRLYVKKDGVLTHDCYPILDGVEPKVYDAVTGQTIAKFQGTVSYGED